MKIKCYTLHMEEGVQLHQLTSPSRLVSPSSKSQVVPKIVDVLLPLLNLEFTCVSMQKGCIEVGVSPMFLSAEQQS